MTNGTRYRSAPAAAATRPLPAIAYAAVMALIWLPVLYLLVNLFYP
jgi:hypothetical protein